MSETQRFVFFLSVVLAVWTAMHLYVFSRLWTLPRLNSPAAHKTILLAGFFLWSAYFLGRFLAHRGYVSLAGFLEVAGAVWMGILFLALAFLFFADVATGFGWLFASGVPAVRSAALLLAVFFSVFALVQGLRPPVVKDIEVPLAGLPAALEGKVLVQLTDLHLGTLLRDRWLRRILRQVESLRPDMVAVTGDLVDGDVSQVEPLLPLLRELRAPLGVWAVTGNHEIYAGRERSLRLLEAAGYRVLTDSAMEAAPGLVMGGVDDLSARRQFGVVGDPLQKALGSRPNGAVIFLCHSPLLEARAAELGAGLMLCGHTHNGQIWPFGYIVRLFYPRIAGRFTVGNMEMLVSRGAGTWGPPMRLFQRGEIVRVTLRSKAAS